MTRDQFAGPSHARCSGIPNALMSGRRPAGTGSIRRYGSPLRGWRLAGALAGDVGAFDTRLMLQLMLQRRVNWHERRRSIANSIPQKMLILQEVSSPAAVACEHLRTAVRRSPSPPEFPGRDYVTPGRPTHLRDKARLVRNSPALSVRHRARRSGSSMRPRRERELIGDRSAPSMA